MIPAERQQFIRAALDARGMVGIADMAEQLGVSHMTVRRDMQILETQGYLKLISGGAQKTGRIEGELSQAEKRRLHYSEKAAVAEKAVSLITPGAAVYFDAGTTCLAIAEAVTEREDLRDSIFAVSNDFTVVSHLMAYSNCRLFHTGGEVLRENKSTSGETAASMVSRLNIDIAFISTSSWDAEWVSTPAESKVAVKVAAAKAARRSYLVTDSSKFGQVGLFNILPLRELDGVITDSALPLQARKTITASGVALILVDPLRKTPPL